MKRWIIIGLTVLVVLVISYAEFSYFSHKLETARFGTTKSEQLAKPININTASQAELQSLKGIGPVISNKLETARFGTTKSEHLAKPININTASEAELQSIKGIGPIISKRIIEGRPYNDISDILKVKGIGPKKFASMKDNIIIN